MTLKPGVGESNRRRAKAPIVRFWQKVDKNGPIHPKFGPCWLWIGGKNQHGYGQIQNYDKKMEVHRFSWIHLVGEIEGGLFVLHRCDNPACVNSAHLFLGTQRDNMLDMRAKGRGKIVSVGRSWTELSKAKIAATRTGTKMRRCDSCGGRCFLLICKRCEKRSIKQAIAKIREEYAED